MDTRKDDLEELSRIFNNEGLPTEVRRRAYQSYQEIQRQLSNRPLMEAHRAGDSEAVEKITDEIHARFGH